MSRKQQQSLLHTVHPHRPTEAAGSLIWSLLLHPVLDLCSLFPNLCLMFLHTSPKFPTSLSSALRCSVGPRGLLLAHSSRWRWQGATAKREKRPEIGIVDYLRRRWIFALIIDGIFGKGDTLIFSANNRQSPRQHPQIKEEITQTLPQEGGPFSWL